MVSVLRRLSHIALHLLFIYLVSFIMDKRDHSEELLHDGSTADSDAAEVLATPVKGIAGQVMIALNYMTLYFVSANT